MKAKWSKYDEVMRCMVPLRDMVKLEIEGEQSLCQVLGKVFGLASWDKT